MDEGEKTIEQIPAEVREAIRAELDADAADHRGHVPEGAWAVLNNGACPEKAGASAGVMSSLQRHRPSTSLRLSN
jgi:hypothetical protein